MRRLYSLCLIVCSLSVSSRVASNDNFASPTPEIRVKFESGAEWKRFISRWFGLEDAAFLETSDYYFAVFKYSDGCVAVCDHRKKLVGGSTPDYPLDGNARPSLRPEIRDADTGEVVPQTSRHRDTIAIFLEDWRKLVVDGGASQNSSIHEAAFGWVFDAGSSKKIKVKWFIPGTKEELGEVVADLVDCNPPIALAEGHPAERSISAYLIVALIGVALGVLGDRRLLRARSS